jgi:hypothetical protein
MRDVSGSNSQTNGKGAAAVMAVGVAALALGVFSLTGDAVPAAAALFSIWKPTGPLSGVTTLAILVWLAAWLFLARQWGAREVDFRRINLAAAALIAVGLMLTFPPIMDFLQGK